ncbi:hypothetical protein PVL30_002003 [Lodderomyces elongisporus]|uniref:uncharacterized protein n=1 Tax=Lodderomyces elongisporus TaxID=36914 RepID=UPI00292455E9|nr:uncharacterized protein PVL30_002003 [Lodderomyces elongisporus]WLF78269.1 hypothetical protein PVL30_002003 [Lodderomyces elongisporus]
MKDCDYDELSAITSLVTSLSQQIGNSSETLNDIDDTLKKLVPPDVYALLVNRDSSNRETKSDKLGEEEEEEERNSQDQDQVSKEKSQRGILNVSEHEQRIRDLQRQRLSLIMELQKQDFITAKLENIIEQYGEIFDTLKDFLKSHDKLQEEERSEAKESLEKYLSQCIFPTLQKLQRDKEGS